MADALDPAQLVGLIDALAQLPSRTQERGRAYAAERRVGPPSLGPDAIEARVTGTREYATRWDALAGRWRSRCTCPLGGACKHAFALGAAVLAQARREERLDDPRLDRLLDDGTSPARSGELKDALHQLRSGRAEWERQAALDTLLSGSPRPGLTPYAPPLLELIREPDPDLRCWQLATTIADLADGWLPEPLRPFEHRSDLADRYAARERAALAADLLGWASGRAERARRSLRLVCSLERRGRHAAALVFEVRVTTPRAADAPRTLAQLQSLRAEMLRDPAIFPPEQAAALDWLADHAVSAGPAPESRPRFATALTVSLLERVAGSGMAAWATDLDPELAARGGVTPGAMIRLHPGAAELVPACRERRGEVVVELHFRWPDGRERRLDEAVYVSAGGHRGTLVLADGAFTRLLEEPPQRVLDRFRALGPLPLGREERAAFVGALAARFPHLRETLAAHSRTYPVAVSVALDLRPDDWLQVRAFAQVGARPWQPGDSSVAGAPLFEYTPDRGWARIAPESPEPMAPIAADASPDSAPSSAPPATVLAPGPSALAPPPAEPAADDDIWAEMPDPARGDPIVRWLESLPVAPGIRNGGHEPNWPDRGTGWWMRATRRTMEAFGTRWEERPAETTYFGSERVRRLLASGPRTVVPHLRITGTGIDWLRVSAEWAAEALRLSDADLARLRGATTRFVKLDSGWVRRDVAEEQEAVAEALADLGIDPDGGEHRLSVWQVAGASPATLRTLEQLGGDAGTLEVLARLRASIEAFSGIDPLPVPAGLTAQLRPYQRHGLDFLANATRLGLGAVLADDMGLGKTVQALAWLLHLVEQAPNGGPSLVVCPASVVHNWAREAERFAPQLRVLLLTSGKLRHALRDAIPEHDLVVTTYALLRRDLEAWRSVRLRAAILDEAQFIKNPDAAVSKAALELDAAHRLALTGTPLENRALDLWSILAFVNRGYLGNRADFAAKYDRIDAPPHTRVLLAAKLRPVLLRRTKQAVAPELPPRIEERLDCELTTAQRHLYATELQRSRTLLDELGRAPGGVGRQKITILAALTRLRQICCHPALAGGRADLDSGKFEAFFELIEPILAEGHKVLVFSQFVQNLKLLAAALRARDLPLHVLTGQTTRREQVVAAFQDDPRPCVFLVSLKAGGTGLNLTAASYVVLFEPWWNPAVEAQAIDRTHRIGQDRTVIAYRLLTRGTIEERIWELQQRKAALVRDVLGETGFARALTRDDLEFLLADA